MIDLRIISVSNHETYKNIAKKDPKALYFLTDIGKLYKGDIEIKGYVSHIEAMSHISIPFYKTLTFRVSDEGGERDYQIPFTAPDEIKEYIDSKNGGCLIETTWRELYDAMYSKSLVAGTQYRITDFVTTCNSAGSTSNVITSSAEHQFDIIVTADNANTLNTNARVCLHDRDTYFAGSKLSEWVIKYDINNDKSKYQWANPLNGKGVIYYMCDEFGNECPYDFKNILFDDCYTFHVSSSKTDFSLNGAYCFENKINGYYSGDSMILNNIVFKNTAQNAYCRGNVFDINCYNNSFNHNCSNNRFGIFCSGNTFASKCSFISFKNGCQNNKIDNQFQYLYMGDNCKNITINISKATTVPLEIQSNITDYVISSRISVPTKIGKNSSGVIKIYNEADLVG